MISPCKGCDRRKLGCHGSCEVFQKWTACRNEISLNRQRFHESRRFSRDHERNYRRGLKKGFDNK